MKRWLTWVLLAVSGDVGVMAWLEWKEARCQDGSAVCTSNSCSYCCAE